MNGHSLTYMFSAIAVMALVMAGLRAAPFLLFGNGERPPRTVLYLGRIMAPAAVGMILVYCGNGIALDVWPSAFPELIAAAAIVAAHLLWRNMILSVFGGTLLYMGLIQFIFV